MLEKKDLRRVVGALIWEALVQLKTDIQTTEEDWKKKKALEDKARHEEKERLEKAAKDAKEAELARKKAERKK